MHSMEIDAKATDGEHAKTEQKSRLLALPRGILVTILSSLDAFSVQEMGVTCKFARHEAVQPHVWETRCLAIWGTVLNNSNPRREFWTRLRLRYDGLYCCHCKYLRMIRDVGNMDPYLQTLNPKTPRPTVVEVQYFRYLYFYPNSQQVLILRSHVGISVAQKVLENIIPRLAAPDSRLSALQNGGPPTGENAKVANDVVIGTYNPPNLSDPEPRVTLQSLKTVSPNLTVASRMCLGFTPPPPDAQHRLTHVLECTEFVTTAVGGANGGQDSHVDLQGSGFVFQRMPFLAHLSG